MTEDEAADVLEAIREETRRIGLVEFDLSAAEVLADEGIYGSLAALREYFGLMQEYLRVFATDTFSKAEESLSQLGIEAPRTVIAGGDLERGFRARDDLAIVISDIRQFSGLARLAPDLREILEQGGLLDLPRDNPDQGNPRSRE